MKKTELIFHHIKNAYDIKKSDSIYSELYQRYIQDENATRQINGLTYYKIIDLYEFRRNNYSVMVLLDSKMKLQIGDVLMDEKRNRYTILAIEMPHILEAVFPEWYLKISFVVTDGDPYQIGNYLAKI